MKQLFKSTLLVLLMAAIFVGCKEEEEETPAEMIVGKWTISSTSLAGISSDGDNSYLDFAKCAGICSGIDYDGSDSTSGTFTYVLNDDGTSLVITDTQSAGGINGDTYVVTELTDSDLTLKTTLIGFDDIKYYTK